MFSLAVLLTMIVLIVMMMMMTMMMMMMPMKKFKVILFMTTKAIQNSEADVFIVPVQLAVAVVASDLTPSSWMRSS